MMLHVGWAINRIPCCSSDAWLRSIGLALAIWCWQVGTWLEESNKTHSRRLTAVCTCMQVDRARVISITGACLGSQASTRAKGCDHV